MSERSGVQDRSKQGGASKRVSGASERANVRASGPVLQSEFLVILTHSPTGDDSGRETTKERGWWQIKQCSIRDSPTGDDTGRVITKESG